MVLSSEEEEEFRSRGAQLEGRPDAQKAFMQVTGPLTGKMTMTVPDLLTIYNFNNKLTSKDIDLYFSLIMRDNECLVSHDACGRVGQGANRRS